MNPLGVGVERFPRCVGWWCGGQESGGETPGTGAHEDTVPWVVGALTGVPRTDLPVGGVPWAARPEAVVRQGNLPCRMGGEDGAGWLVRLTVASPLREARSI